MSAPARRSTRPRAAATTTPLAPRHEDTVLAFHAGQLGAPTRERQIAARIVVDRLLCDWCSQSLAGPRVCRCQW